MPCAVLPEKPSYSGAEKPAYEYGLGAVGHNELLPSIIEEHANENPSHC